MTQPDTNIEKEYGWIKYRHNEASGRGLYEFMEIELPFTPKQRKALRERLEDEFSYHGLYRGVDIQRIDCPPKSYLKREIERAKDNIKYKMLRIERFNILMKNAPDKKFAFWAHSGMVSDYKPGGKGWKRILADDIYEARKILDARKKS